MKLSLLGLKPEDIVSELESMVGYRVEPEAMVPLTLSFSCPYLGMLFLIITPPSAAGRFGDFLS